MSEANVTIALSSVNETTNGIVGRPNGKTEKRRALKRMTPDERKAHRKTWKTAQKAKAKK